MSSKIVFAATRGGKSNSRGAEKLQELVAMLERIEGRYDATFGLTTEPEPTAIEAFRDTVALIVSRQAA